MIRQIPDESKDLEQLVYDGKTLQGAAVEPEDGSQRLVVQVTVDARGIGIALAQRPMTPANPVRAGPKEMLSRMDLEGLLIQADALQATRPFFSNAWSREPTRSSTSIE